jgi:hypothetical protein
MTRARLRAVRPNANRVINLHEEDIAVDLDAPPVSRRASPTIMSFGVRSRSHTLPRKHGEDFADVLFYQVAPHELGHALGLPHSSGP